MPDDSDKDENEVSEKRQVAKEDFQNKLHNLNMNLLTSLAKPILPAGYWSKNQAARRIATSRQINLTFDDGPNPATTLELLVVLSEENVKGTFFFIGDNVRRYPELVQAVHKAGHTIANHSLDHMFLPALSTRAIEKQIDVTNNLIMEITASSAALFRPPFGLMDKRAAAILKERQMSAVYWGAMADDYRAIGEAAVVKRIMHAIPGNELVVLHEGQSTAQQTINATREIIKRSKELGHTFEPIQPPS